MGQKKIKRPLRVVSTIRCSSALTVDAGNVNITAGGVDLPVSTGSTGTDMVSYGMSIVGTTGSTSAETYTLATPTVGVEKFIEIRTPSSDAAHVIRASSGGAVTFNGTDHIATCSTAGDGNITMHLVGATTDRYGILGYVGTLTFSTS